MQLCLVQTKQELGMELLFSVSSLYLASLSHDELLGDHTPPRKRPVRSPFASPMPVEKYKRRRRTLTERLSPHSHTIVPPIRNNPATHSDEYKTQNLPRLTIQNYRPHAVEKSLLDSLRSDIYKVLLGAVETL